MMKTIYSATLLGLALSVMLPPVGVSAESNPRPTAGQVTADMKRVADWQIEHVGDVYDTRLRMIPHAPDFWPAAAMYVGMEKWAAIADDESYYDWLKEVSEKLDWKLRQERFYHADDHCVGQLYLNLYRKYGEERMIAPTREQFDQIIAKTPTRDLTWKHEVSQDRWSWCDALFMAPPVWARLSAITGDPKYRDWMFGEYQATRDYLFDEEEKLFFRDSRFFERRHNGNKIFWSRGNGWVFGGLALLLPEIPKDTEQYEYFATLYREMAEKLVSIQTPEGHWAMSLLEADAYPTPETSGTGFFCFGLTWGINNGLLDRATYEPAVLKAWNAMTRRITEDGMLGYVQPIGAEPGQAWPDRTEMYGSGAFLAAGAEVYRLVKSDPAGARYRDASLPVDVRVADLLGRMSLEEKVSQMRIFHANKGVEFSDDDMMVLSEDVIPRLEYGIAGIKNPGEPLTPLRAAELNNQLQKYIMEKSRFGIPALFVTESYNGVDAHGCTRFGRPINMAASWDVELTRRIWNVVGREARLRGMHMCHSPEGDIVRDPRFGRMSEAWGEDTCLTTEMVVGAVTGVQGGYDGTGRNTTHIGAVTKHFAGYGQVIGGSNFAAIEISPRTLIDEIFPPFKAAVQRAHTLGIMASHGDLNGIASHANRELLTQILRKKWGFKGYVVSDSNDIARLHSFMKVAETPEDAVRMALEAGMDIDLYSDLAYALLAEMATKDPSLMAYIDRSAAYVLRTKFVLGLFEQPFVDLEQVHEGVRAESSLELARRADLESIILLKNEGNALPLVAEDGMKIALMGPLLGEDTRAEFERVAGEEVVFSSEQGFTLTDGRRGTPTLSTGNEAAISKMVEMADDADLSILFLGGDEYTAKEAYFNGGLGDRDSIDPVGDQDAFLRKVKALGKPVIVVLKHRRTLSINAIAEEADAILDCWDLSEFGDETVARTVFGEVSPSGKLPVTVPRSIGQLPFHYSQKEINYHKGYLFSSPGPLYPFGHGLSYTTFDYANLRASSEEMEQDGELTIRVDVTNSGDRAAKEVVQLYIKDLIGSVVRPDKELKAFQKIELQPGETSTVQFTITPEMLRFTGLDMTPVVEAGDYQAMVGTSSADHQAIAFRVKETM